MSQNLNLSLPNRKIEVLKIVIFQNVSLYKDFKIRYHVTCLYFKNIGKYILSTLFDFLDSDEDSPRW